MADTKHLDFLKQCLAEDDIVRWNSWLQDVEGLKPKEIVTISGTKYRRVDLSGVDLSGFNLEGACLNGADLTGTCLNRTAERKTTPPDKTPSRREIEASKLERDALENRLQRLRIDASQNAEKNERLGREIARKEKILERKNEEIEANEQKLKRIISSYDDNIQNAFRRFDAPNAYIDRELVVYRRLFRVYVAVALVLGLYVVATAMLETPFLPGRAAVSAEPVDNPYGYLDRYGSRIAALVLLGVFINLFSRARRRIHLLQERRRGVESFIAALRAIRTLSTSVEAIDARFNAILDDFAQDAIRLFLFRYAEKEDSEAFEWKEYADRLGDLASACRHAAQNSA